MANDFTVHNKPDLDIELDSDNFANTDKPSDIDTEAPENGLNLPTKVIDSGLLQGRIEAALFLTSRPLHVNELAELLGAPFEDVEESLIQLIQEYAYRGDNAALEIDDTDGYILQVRDLFADVVERMMPVEISAATLRTLSAIAIKAPILQSDLVESRGANAYEHIQELLKKKLISKRRQGRSFVLNVTPQFHAYFQLLGDKKDLEHLLKQEAVAREFSKLARRSAGADLDE